MVIKDGRLGTYVPTAGTNRSLVRATTCVDHRRSAPPKLLADRRRPRSVKRDDQEGRQEGACEESREEELGRRRAGYASH